MILIIGIILILFSYYNKKQYVASMGFAFVFITMGFQSNVKGDFYNYMELFNRISISSNIANASTVNMEKEPFFPYINSFFSWSPFWLFILLISLFQSFVLVKFVDKYSCPSYKWISAILFFFTFTMMPLQMKAIRQGVAIEMMVLAFLLLESRKIVCTSLSIVLSIAAYYTHNSSLELFPFLFLFWITLKSPYIINRIGNHRIMPWIVLSLYFFIYIVKSVFLEEIFVEYTVLLGGDDFRYAKYVDGTNQMEGIQFVGEKSTPIIIIIYDAIVVFLSAWFFQKTKSQMRLYTLIVIVCAFVDMLFRGMGSLQRAIMYYIVFGLIVYPNIAQELELRCGKVYSRSFVFLLLGNAIYSSLYWFYDSTEDHFGNYTFNFLQ